MKSRIAMTAMLVSGLLMSGTGAGLAVSGLGQSDNASSAQYNRTDPPPTPPTPPATPTPPTTPPATTTVPSENDTLPTSTQSTPRCDEDSNGVIDPLEAAKNGCGEVAAETDSGSKPETAKSAPTEPTTREQAAQPARQVEASSADELPFTGFAAVPILVGGIALLGGGLVLRRRTA